MTAGIAKLLAAQVDHAKGGYISRSSVAALLRVACRRASFHARDNIADFLTAEAKEARTKEARQALELIAATIRDLGECDLTESLDISESPTPKET